MKTIVLNGKDCTKMFARSGYSVSYRSVQGGNGGVMLDGSYTDDELAIKADIKLPIVPLSEDDVEKLLSIIYENNYVVANFYDPKEKKYRSSVFRRSKMEQKYRGFGSNKKEYWTGSALTLMEK